MLDGEVRDGERGLTIILSAAWLRASKYMRPLMSVGKPSRTEFILALRYCVNSCM
jgi:hypothetical protein